MAENEGSLVFELMVASSFFPCAPNSHWGGRGVKDFNVNYTCFHRRLPMGLAVPSASSARPRRSFFLTAVLAATLGWAGCGSGRTVVVPPTRPIIVSSGERLRAAPERMDSIVVWLEAETINIQEDPTFLIRAVPTARETLPWLGLTIEGDTASIQYDRAHPDITTVFDVYAHLHLMKSMGRLDEWLPEHADKEGFELEREIVARAADVWLIGRAAFGAPAYGPLDELIYAREAGYLDPFILVARSEEFAEERAAWDAERAEELAAYRTWFRRVFDREPPGLREAAGGRGR